MQQMYLIRPTLQPLQLKEYHDFSFIWINHAVLIAMIILSAISILVLVLRSLHTESEISVHIFAC